MIIIQSRVDKSNDGRFDHNVLVQYKPPLPPIEVKNPYPNSLPKMSIAGPVNGILCIFQPPLGDALTLWNPAMNKSKMVMRSKTINPSQKVSVGLAFDSQKKDLLILRIFCVPPFPGYTKTNVEFEIREMKYLLGWKKLKSKRNYFYIDKPSCDAIFKAEPYWMAYDYEKYIPGKYERLVRFKVSKMDFEWLLLPFVGVGDYYATLANFEDSLGFLIWWNRDNSYIDVWEVDDKKFQWRKKCKIGPLSGFGRILGCLRNGDIVAENEDGVVLFYAVNKSELVVQNDENLYPCSVKKTLTVENSEKGSHVIFDCPEGLLLIEGMLTHRRRLHTAAVTTLSIHFTTSVFCSLFELFLTFYLFAYVNSLELESGPNHYYYISRPKKACNGVTRGPAIALLGLTVEPLRFLAIMTKSTRSNDNSPTEMGELREMMQKLVSEMGVLIGEVASLKKLDRTVSELKEQLEGNQRDNSPVEDGVEASGARQSRERQPMEEETETETLWGTSKEIKKIKQTGSVKEYQAIFERKLARVNELNLAVKLTNPTSLPQVFKTARMQEAYLTAQAKSTRQNSFANT
ncbi:hypothetical protein FXO37_27741 [Capsicum annuum]|nr:hypothetical protein FXO37_27741 [Capsicum annuum]